MFLTESSVAARSNLNLRFNYECLAKQKQKQKQKEVLIETEVCVCVDVIGAEIQKAKLLQGKYKLTSSIWAPQLSVRTCALNTRPWLR